MIHQAKNVITGNLFLVDGLKHNLILLVNSIIRVLWLIIKKEMCLISNKDDEKLATVKVRK